MLRTAHADFSNFQTSETFAVPRDFWQNISEELTEKSVCGKCHVLLMSRRPFLGTPLGQNQNLKKPSTKRFAVASRSDTPQWINQKNVTKAQFASKVRDLSEENLKGCTNYWFLIIDFVCERFIGRSRKYHSPPFSGAVWMKAEKGKS